MYACMHVCNLITEVLSITSTTIEELLFIMPFQKLFSSLELRFEDLNQLSSFLLPQTISATIFILKIL